MSRLLVVFVVLAILLTAQSTFAQSSGTHSLGWVTIVGSQAVDSGFVFVSINGNCGYSVEYDYSPTDTVDSVLAGLATSFNNSSSPVSASVANNVLVLTSKTIGSACNGSLGADYGGTSFSTGAVGMIGGRDGPRNFSMILYVDITGADGDQPFVYAPTKGNPDGSVSATAGQQQPGHSIVAFGQGVNAWYPDGFAQLWNDAMINVNHFDLNRIDAVNIDEPYTSVIQYLYDRHILSSNSADGDPCAPTDPRQPYILHAYAQLQAAAAAIKQSSPRIRFWVNFESHELDWMRHGSCAFLNAPYIDVVSLDEYLQDFVTTVKPNYDWLLAHPGYSGQQLALVPGTFVHSSGLGTDPVAQVKVVEEYLDYAASSNRSCNLPLGSSGLTGDFDRCPVWRVAGFLYPDCPACPDYIGLADPATTIIQDAWKEELSHPIFKAIWWPAIEKVLQ